MSFRLLHTSDWHLGRILHERPLLDDQRQILGRIVEQCRTGGYDALAISGDLFDRSLPSEDAVRLWSAFLRDLRAACPALPLLAIAGNHDSAARVAYAADALALAGIHVRGGAEGLEVPVALTAAGGQRLQAWLLPFLWAGDLDGGDGAPRAARTQEATLAAALDRIRPGQDPEALQLVLAHCFARGGQASESERVLVGTATDVDAALFEGFDYVALGHLHRRQRVGARAWYPGSPLPYAFSEAGDPKGMLEVVLRPGEVPEVAPVPLEAPRPLRRLRGTLVELLEDPRFAADAGALVEATLDQADAGAHPFALLRQRFPNLLHLRYAEEDSRSLAALPAPAERVGDLLDDYRRFAQDLGLDEAAVAQRAALVAGFAEDLERP